MQLLPEDKLIWSPVVANSRMNRERNASGINSYEQEFKFKPEVFLQQRIVEQGAASWLDLCCGQGKALVQVAESFLSQNLGDRIHLEGVDLIGDFVSSSTDLHCLHFEMGNIAEFKTERQYDLITCVHGLHYVGNKLEAIEKAMHLLKPTGQFWANLDLENIVINHNSSSDYLKDMFRQSGFVYNSRTKILKGSGANSIHFGLKYKGADDQYGPNYTGQPSVCSYYEK